MSTAAATEPAFAPPRSLAAWQAKALHTVTCPSGQRLRIRIRGLATILEAGDLPEDLVDIAFTELTHEMGAAGAITKDLVGGEVSDEQRTRALRRMREFGRLQRHLVCVSVEEMEQGGDWQPVTLTLDDLDVLPEDDLAMVAEIVQRLRGQDARGVTIGVDPLDRWASFREAHGCAAEGCEGCETVVRLFSSAHLGQV